jgi:2-keto-4-pentenoate hydratase
MSETGETLENLLADARSRGTPLPLPDCTPSLTEAYDVQRAIMRRSNLPVMVWKLGLTSAPAREAFGASEPAVGRLAASAILGSRTEARHIWPETFAEAEIVFEMGQDLPPAGAPYTRESVIPAIKAIHGGIELAAPRYDTSDLPLGLFLADNAMGHALVFGDRLSAHWEQRFADLAVSIFVNDEVQEHGNASRVMGNPLDALVWLANWLCENGENGLRRNQLVTSGSCTGASPVCAGDVITAIFGGIDAARVTLVA